MLIESPRKLFGDFTRVHAFNLPSFQHVDSGAVLERTAAVTNRFAEVPLERSC
jgi:hypothetical protein